MINMIKIYICAFTFYEDIILVNAVKYHFAVGYVFSALLIDMSGYSQGTSLDKPENEIFIRTYSTIVKLTGQNCPQ